MRKTFTLIALSLVAICTSANLSMAQYEDWAHFERYSAANAEVDFRPQAVFMGDSITDNWGRWDSDFFTQNGFVGRGISGQTSAQMLVRFRRDVIELSPKAVVILCGTNDIAQNKCAVQIDDVMRNIKSMCELAKANGIKPVLCTILPSSQFSWRKQVQPIELIRQLNSMIIAYAAEQKIPLVDYYPALVAEDGSLPEKWSRDNCHPSLECYRNVMEPMVCDCLNALLKPRKSERFHAIEGE